MSSDAGGLIRAALEEAASSLDRLRHDAAALAAIEAAGHLLAGAFGAGHRAYSCGTAARCAMRCISPRS